MVEPLRILILEDVAADAKLMERELRGAGLEFVARCVETEPDFLAALEEFRPEIVLSDYSLPSFNGIDAVRLVQQRSPATPVIIVTGSLSDETAATCIKVGAVDYVLKERLGRLPAAVRGALERRRFEEDRRRAEEALRESEERYRSLFEQSPLGIYRTTPDGRILVANPALLQILGYASLDELRSRNLEESGFQPEYPRQAFKDAIEREGEVRGFETIWVMKNGGRAYGRQSARAIRDADGRTLFYEGVVEDVTAQRRGEDALRHSEAQYRHLFESAGDAIMVFEPETETIFDANPKACELYGFTRDELIGTSVKRLIVDVARAEDRIANVGRSTHVQPFETVHLRRDGTPVDLEVSMSVIDYRGHPARLVTARDITKRKQGEEERRRLSVAMEQSAEAVVITDSGGVIQYVNPAFTWITNYRADEVIGLNPRVLKSGQQNPSFYAEMWTTIAHGSVWTGKLTNRRKDGTLYEEEMSISPIRAENGTIINYVAVGRDVTEEIALQAQLRQAQKMEAVGMLAGGVAHDFNNLLQAMLSHVEVVRGRYAEAAQMAATMADLEAEIRRGSALTRQLLLLARRETAKLEQLDLNEVIGSAATFLRRLVRANVAFSVELADEALPVTADRGQIDQVLMNLAVNAADAMPGGGRLTIRSGSHGRAWVWFAADDTGSGIPIEIRERIFEPFFTTKAQGKGTGLGLSVVHGIVTQHHGVVEIQDVPGGGTSFRVTLPRAGSREHPEVVLPTVDASSTPAGHGERVLVVEDEEGARQGLTEILRMLGYDVVAVGSGEEAGLLPSQPGFDVLLTDMMLPGIAGEELARGLLDRWPALKVIFMSGYAQDEAVRRGALAGRVHFLQKPFDMASLAREIRAALEE
jgi:PAS domain S-box-containing protein